MVDFTTPIMADLGCIALMAMEDTAAMAMEVTAMEVTADMEVMEVIMMVTTTLVTAITATGIMEDKTVTEEVTQMLLAIMAQEEELQAHPFQGEIRMVVRLTDLQLFNHEEVQIL